MALYELSDEEVRFIKSLLQGQAAMHAATFDRRAQVKAEILISRLRKDK
jgi:hypothetical protein